MTKYTQAQIDEKASELVSCLEIWGVEQIDAADVAKSMRRQILARPYAKWNKLGLHEKPPVNLAEALPADVNEFLTRKSEN